MHQRSFVCKTEHRLFLSTLIDQHQFCIIARFLAFSLGTQAHFSRHVLEGAVGEASEQGVRCGATSGKDNHIIVARVLVFGNYAEFGLEMLEDALDV